MQSIVHLPSMHNIVDYPQALSECLAKLGAMAISELWSYLVKPGRTSYVGAPLVTPMPFSVRSAWALA